MELRIVQINLNKCQVAQDLLAQWVNEQQIDICIIQEPWKGMRSGWFSSKDENAAIWWNRKCWKNLCAQIFVGDYTVVIETIGK